ncbi:MAG: phosphate ABC transporter permease PstA [Gammaproteobacteria bacterium]
MLDRFARRRLINIISLSATVLAVAIGLCWLGWILSTLLQQGLVGLHWDVFTKITQPPGSSGGLLNAIVGSLLMAGTAILIGTPAGLLIGIFLAEYGNASKLAVITRFVNDVLLSAPSILLGLFVYQLLVIQVKHFSGWAGAFALALLVIPVVTRTTENMFRLVPNTLREAAAALGTPQWKIILSLILRVSRTGVLTGILLALARIIGETAPLLFTALNNQFLSFDMNRPMANLPTVIFQYAMSPYADWHRLAWQGALIITFWVLSLNILVRVIFKQKPPLH